MLKLSQARTFVRPVKHPTQPYHVSANDISPRSLLKRCGGGDTFFACALYCSRISRDTSLLIQPHLLSRRHHHQCLCYDQNPPMRTFAPTVSTVRATTSFWSQPAAAASAQWRILLPAAARWLGVGGQQRRGLAKVNNAKELGLGQDAWFSSTGPSAYPVEGPGSGQDHRPPDERTIKLGKSMLSQWYWH